MSARERGPRRPTVVKSFADIPRPESPAEERARRIAERGVRRAAMARRSRMTTITWLREPAMIGGVPVLGVCEDVCDDTKAMYL